MSQIVLDYKRDVGLFDETAKGWAEKIYEDEDCSVKSSQLRNFYEKVMELEEKAVKLTDDQFREDVLPFVKMLNSKVAYANTRKTVSREFVEMMNQCIGQVRTVEDLKVFKLFFEAVIGFYPKK